jgi:hypothetical protein
MCRRPMQGEASPSTSSLHEERRHRQAKISLNNLPRNQPRHRPPRYPGGPGEQLEGTWKDSDADKVKLSQALKTTKAAYTATRSNLASKSKECDDAVIQEQEANTLWEQAEVKLVDAKKRLTPADGEKKDQGLLLETA